MRAVRVQGERRRARRRRAALGLVAAGVATAAASVATAATGVATAATGVATAAAGELSPGPEAPRVEFVVPATGRSLRRLGLAEALDVALAGNLELALARAGERAAAGARLAAVGDAAPELRAGLEGGRTSGRVQGSFGELREVDFSTYADGAALVYEANLGARIQQALAAGREVEAARHDALSTEQRLLERVALLHQDLMLAWVGVDIAREVVAGSEEFLDVVAARTQGGVGLGADVARARAKLASDRQQEVRAWSILEEVSTRLGLVLRLTPETLLAPAESRMEPAQSSVEESVGKLTAAALARPDVLAERLRVRGAARRLGAARWDIAAPDLVAEARQIELGDSTGDRDLLTDRRALLVWTFSLGEIGDLKRLRAESAGARLRSIGVEERARAEAQLAWRDLQDAAARLPLAGEGRLAAAEALELSQARFTSGLAIALEVLDAQDVLANARFDLARAITDYNRSRIRLLAASGRIDRARLLDGGP